MPRVVPSLKMPENGTFIFSRCKRATTGEMNALFSEKNVPLSPLWFDSRSALTYLHCIYGMAPTEMMR